MPVAPLLLEALHFSELGSTPKSSPTERPIDWAVLVKVSAADSTKRSYQEGHPHLTYTSPRSLSA